MFKILLLIVAISFFQACGSPSADTSVSKAANNISPTPVPTSITPKDGDYNGKGVVTKINMELGSVEVDHEEIKDMMPAMKMEFYVTDKDMLPGLKVGDKVDFVLRYKAHTETITSIKKTR